MAMLGTIVMQSCYDGRQWNTGEPAGSNEGSYRNINFL